MRLLRPVRLPAETLALVYVKSSYIISGVNAELILHRGLDADPPRPKSRRSFAGRKAGIAAGNVFPP